MDCSMLDRTSGTFCAMLYVNVGMKCRTLFLDGSDRKKKNEAKSSFCSSHHSAIDLEIQDLPEPAAP